MRSPPALRALAAALLCGCAVLTSAGSPALAQTAASPSPSAVDEAFEAAKAAFERLPEAEQRAVQEALVWTGDYASVADGTFGRRTYEGVQAFQKRAKQAANGIVLPAGAGAIKAAGNKARAAAGFAPARDAPTGIELGIPRKLLPKSAKNGTGGTRFQSADEKVTLDTRAQPGGTEELKELFERTVGLNAPGRVVSYKVLRSEFFVVAGETQSGRFYIRMAAGPGGLRGFSVGYDKAAAPEWDRVTIAISNSFVPFPGAAVASGPAAQPGGQAAATARPEQNLAAGPRSVPPMSGVVIGPRHVLTAAAVEECREPLVAGGRARLVRADKGRGAALLELPAARRAAPVPAREAADAQDLVALFVAPAEGPRPVVAPVRAAGPNRLAGPLQAGAAGGPVFDRTGALVGLVGAVPEGPRMVAGLIPPQTYAYVTLPAVREIAGAEAGLASATGTAGASRSVGDLAAALAAAVVQVTCAPAPR